jgi:predicted enzyme related to lactoylglutathione lyase
MTKIPNGRFVWFEHVSKDQTKAQAFLGELFNWTTGAMPGPNGTSYTLIKTGETMVGGYPPAMPNMPDVPPHWISHLQTDNAAATASKIKSLGGKVLVEPTEMGGMGTYALVQDPLGGAFCLWQPKQAEGGEWKGIDGSFCWNELYTNDVEKSVAFYAAVGGFEVERQDMGEMGVYTVLKSDGKPRAGIMKAPMPSIPQSWMPYVQVANADTTHDKAKRLGGTVIVPPKDIPTVGRFAILTDTLGAVIGILQPAR